MAGGRIARGWRRWLLIVLVAFAGLAAWGLATERSGLFNNRGDEASAIREHELAWRRMGRGQEIPRLDMLMLIRDRDGECLTGEPNWVTVELGQRLDMRLRDRRTPIECRFRVRARWFDGLFGVHVWTVVLTPVSEERLRIVETRRNYLQ